ncbi:MAG: PIG-L family deacetylase [Oscillospiraceae bacterium]|nr:PIG-L family deacetylase [Oscillospiraceae bacterium]
MKELLQEIRNRKKENRKAESNELKQCMIDANKIIGIEKVFSFDCPGNRFGSVPLLDIVKVIEKVKINFNPNIIFTHFAKDMKLDHVITNRAVLTATRPMSGETVKEIYAFEVLSSTEWNFPLTFSPDYFVDITSTISKKQSAMKIYKNELRDFPHPRSLGGIELNAKYWRIKIGLDKCEAFQMLRKIWDSPLSWMIRVPKISHLYMLQEHAA